MPYPINWLSYTYLAYDGYGKSSSDFARALTRAGVRVTPLSYWLLEEAPGDIVHMAGIDFNKLTISYMPSEALLGVPGRHWNYSMWESDTVPTKWAEKINETCERLLLTTECLIDVFRRAGVKRSIPIDIVPLGIVPEQLPYIDRSKYDRAFTFLALGDRGGRKGDDLAYQAFYKAFQGVKDVRLIIKTRKDGYTHYQANGSDPRVTVWRADIPSMVDVYAAADVFVAPSKYEGYGLPHREAAATGMPVIATRFSGLAEGIDHWALPIETYKLVDCPAGGRWARASVDDIVDRMRWCYECRTEAWERAKAASEWVKQHQSMAVAAQKMIDLLNKWV